MRIRIALVCLVVCAFASAGLTRNQDSKQTVAIQSADRPGATGVSGSKSMPRPEASARYGGGDPQETPPIAGTSFRTYGYYDAMTGAAVEGETWTFDHGAPDPMEGWGQDDMRGNDFTAFRRVTAAGWAGHDNVPAAPTFGSTGAMWVGFFEDEADALCWVDGLGYGNNWNQYIESDLFSLSGLETLDFDYFYDTEAGYDFVRVKVIDDLGNDSGTLATFTGVGGTPGTPLHFSAPIGVGGIYRIRFEFTSDVAYSDADGFYTTTDGPFGFDNFHIQGGGSPAGATPLLADFESGLQGFTAGTGAPPDPQSGIASAGTYMYTPGCGLGDNGLSGNVMEFHDGAQMHPAYQLDRIVSPAVPVDAIGGAPLNVFAEYDIYADNAAADSVYYTWWWSYYPYNCPSTGVDVWSPPSVPPYIYFNATTQCSRVRVFANDTTGTGGTLGSNAGYTVQGSGQEVIPAGADSVRFYFGIWSTASGQAGNFTPVIDNIRVGVSNANTVRHVPSPAFLTIQEAIDEASPGDTILVAAGEYTGAGNVDLNFNGKNLVLLSEEGFSATILNAQGNGRVMVFQSGESSAAVVNGFTLRRGYVSNDNGGAVHIENASPTFVDCVIDSSSATASQAFGSGGGVYMTNSNSTFTSCQFRNNTATLTAINYDPLSAGDGGAVFVEDSSPSFASCVFQENLAVGYTTVSQPSGQGGAIYIAAAATVALTNCTITGNSTNGGYNNHHGAGVSVHGQATLTGCQISNNQAYHFGGGVYTAGGGTASIRNCDLFGNGAGTGGGIYNQGLDSLSTSEIHHNTQCAVHSTGTLVVDDCDIYSNTGGGLFLSTSSTWSNTRIRGNTAGQGGGVYVFFGTHSLNGCSITGNVASVGGGIYIYDANLALTSCTVAGNRAGTDGGGLWLTGAATMTATSTIVSGNDANASGGDGFINTGGGVSFVCSLADPAKYAGPAAPNYDADTRFFDPQFCGAASPASAPTIAGDYSVAANSAATASNSPCGTFIGSEPVGCSWGSITSISDVGNDQGRVARIRWNRAMWDVWGAAQPITQYSVWRKVVSGLSVTPDVSDESNKNNEPVIDAVSVDDGPVGAEDVPGIGAFAPPGEWEFVSLIPASAQPTYTTTVTTLCDSSDTGICYSRFFIRAHTAIPAYIFDSAPDSGYSVDNLAPSAPQNLMIALGAVASWSPNEVDADFDYFTVYCAPDLGTPLDQADVVTTTTDTTIVLPDSTQDKYVFVTAKDFNGNESAETPRELNSQPTSVAQGKTPTRTALLQNVPNPFNPTTTIRFDLASAEKVTLRVYDVGGHLVRTLVDRSMSPARHHVTWDGVNDAGHTVASGVYFYRLTAGNFTEVKKMTILK